jgi:threonine dehydratase
VPNVDAVVVPIGGGGLIAGVSLAVKSVRPQMAVIGVEPRNVGPYSAALAAGRPVTVEMQPTLADGLAISQVGQLAFGIARQHVDQVVQVSEQEIALAILRLMELEKAVVEGAGAAALAAMLGDQLTGLRGKTVVLVLAGGNIDLTILHRLIEIGMVADGRLVRFEATISDRPGGLARLATLIAEAGASIVDVAHDRAFAGVNLAAVDVRCTVETRDAAHIQELLAMLQAAGIRVTREY